MKPLFQMVMDDFGPAAFRRLCVETEPTEPEKAETKQPPSGGCVLKRWVVLSSLYWQSSRLQAAVC